MQVDSNGTASEHYYAKNKQGDIIAVFDSEGNLEGQYEYDAFGKLLAITDANGNEVTGLNMAAINPIRYRGYYYDNETGFYYVNSRYYDPSTGRFINPDTPEKIIEGEAAYTYCGNDPVNNVDPTGMDIVSVGDGYYVLEGWSEHQYNTLFPTGHFTVEEFWSWYGFFSSSDQLSSLFSNFGTTMVEQMAIADYEYRVPLLLRWIPNQLPAHDKKTIMWSYFFTAKKIKEKYSLKYTVDTLEEQIYRNILIETSSMTNNEKTRDIIRYYIFNDETVRTKYYEKDALVIFTVEQPGKVKNFKNSTHEFTADMVAVKNKKGVYVTNKASTLPTQIKHVVKNKDEVETSYGAVVKQGVYEITPYDSTLGTRGPTINGMNCFNVKAYKAYYWRVINDQNSTGYKSFSNYVENSCNAIQIHRAKDSGNWSEGCITYYDNSDCTEHEKFLKAVGYNEGILVIDRTFALEPFANR